MRSLRLSLLALCLCVPGLTRAEAPPNVLFVAIDDLNDWIGCLDGHPQTLTPHLDRLASSSKLFTNAHCPAAACNPSRTAVMSGISPHRSGLYANEQKLRDVLPEADLLPQHFRNHGYHAMGSGKLLHYVIDARSWDLYFPEKSKENPFPRTLYPKNRPVSLPIGGDWQYQETDWSALEATDEEYGGDWLVSQWVGEQLSREQEKPFFLACGIYRPHEPWFVPAKYYEPFPIESIQLPPGFLEGDLADLPPSGKRRGPNRYFAHIQAHDQWKAAIQGYLASIHYADAMLGRVLDSLDSGPHADSTIVVLWSDHGWHLGEKQHWQKYTAWRAVSRVPLMIRVPEKIAPGLPEGTMAGSTCGAPVNLLSLFSTLSELTGLPPKATADAPSLVPLLKDTTADWPHVSLTHLAQPGNFGLSSRDWRYIRYDTGDEELYHIAQDPYEWTNLAAVAEHGAKLAELRSRAPSEFAQRKETPPAAPEIELSLITGKAAPPTKTTGKPFTVKFVNRQNTSVELVWMDPRGGRRSYGEIAAGEQRPMQVRQGASWTIVDSNTENDLGHFVIEDRSAIAIIPPTERPNILVLIADDWSYPHASALGDPVVKTPTFDRLAKEGVLFSHAFTPAPSCTPSRHALGSGQHHWRLRGGMNLGGSIPAETPVYPDLLAAAGYATGFSRKGSAPSEHRHRCNDSLGTKYRDFGTFFAERDPAQPFCFWYGAGEPHRPYEWGASEQSDKDLETIRVPDCLPDTPTIRTDLGDYLLRVERFDRDAARIVNQLEKEDELENTIVVMTSDNGMPFPRAKATLYDLGTRIPLVVRWGDRIPGGRTLEDFVSLTDLAPTFLEAAGLPIPQEMTGRSLLPQWTADEDGVIDPARDHTLTGMERHVYPYPARAIRTADFLYIRNFSPSQWPTGNSPGERLTFDFTETPWPTVPGAFSHNVDPGPAKQWMLENEPLAPKLHALAFGTRPVEELYDIAKDPAQIQNVATDPAYRAVRDQLSSRLTEGLRGSGDPRFSHPAHASFKIQGWDVYLNDRLWNEMPVETHRMLELMEGQLTRVEKVIPADALRELQKVPIWINPTYPDTRPRCEYHAGAGWLSNNGRDPIMGKAIEVSNTQNFPFENRRMPYLMLHELAHAYHDRVLGFDQAEILAAFDRARDSGSYDDVERTNGVKISRDKAYAITNHKEYFAELTEAYFGKNDFFPFDRAELKKHDPVGYAAIEKAWGIE